MTGNANTQEPGCLNGILRLLGINTTKHKEATVSTTDVYPYRVRDAFLSPAELSFYQVLCSVVGEQAAILSKVGLWDIFYVARPDENRRARAHIDRKHVDFLLCNPETM